MSNRVSETISIYIYIYIYIYHNINKGTEEYK
jgi:hypothetical protein